MDFVDMLQALTNKMEERISVSGTEEATKNALIMPFIQCLGYDPFDPTEVIPEYTADLCDRKGEKVDYAICKEGAPIILVECKPCGSDLNVKHAVQLQRYFNCLTEVRFSVLTNGIRYLFFSDLENSNVMDQSPFLEVNMLKLDDGIIEQLKQFTKGSFDKDSILSNAGELKWTREVLQQFKDEYPNSTDDFVRFFARRVYHGNVTEKVLEKFHPIVRKAFVQFVNAMITERLNRARVIQDEADAEEQEDAGECGTDEDQGITTSEQEWQGYFIVKAILADEIDISRVAMRDVRSYCGILLDDNNRKPICRLWFNSPKRLMVSLFDNVTEEKVPIQGIEELYSLASRLKATLQRYEAPVSA